MAKKKKMPFGSKKGDVENMEQPKHNHAGEKPDFFNDKKKSAKTMKKEPGGMKSKGKPGMKKAPPSTDQTTMANRKKRNKGRH